MIARVRMATPFTWCLPKPRPPLIPVRTINCYAYWYYILKNLSWIIIVKIPIKLKVLAEGIRASCHALVDPRSRRRSRNITHAHSGAPLPSVLAKTQKILSGRRRGGCPVVWEVSRATIKKSRWNFYVLDIEKKWSNLFPRIKRLKMFMISHKPTAKKEDAIGRQKRPSAMKKKWSAPF